MEIIKIQNGHRGSYNLYIVPGKSVEIHSHRENGELVNVKKFVIGDVAEYDSYNLAYIAHISGITAKNVIFGMKKKRLNMESFAWRNHNFDAAQTAKRNAEISMSI